MPSVRVGLSETYRVIARWIGHRGISEQTRRLLMLTLEALDHELCDQPLDCEPTKPYVSPSPAMSRDFDDEPTVSRG